MNKVEFRMSSAGKCPRALSAELLNYPSEEKPKWLLTAAGEGIWHEARLKQELVEQGYQVFDEQLEIMLENNYIEITGHIDGKVTDPEKVRRLLEIKSMSQFQFDKWMKEGFTGFPEYLDQIACYFEATQLDECLYIVKNRSSGYVDKRIIEPIPGHIDNIMNKLTEVADCVSENKLYPAEFDINSIQCRRCEFKNLCIPEPAELDKATIEQLNKAVEDIRLGNRLVAEGKEFYDMGKKILYNHTKASNLGKWKHNNLAILLVNVKEQTTYPKENLLAKYSKEDLADVGKLKEAYSYLRLDDLEAKGE